AAEIALLQFNIADQHNHQPFALTIIDSARNNKRLCQVVECRFVLSLTAEHRTDAAQGFAFTSLITSLTRQCQAIKITVECLSKVALTKICIAHHTIKTAL